MSIIPSSRPQLTVEKALDYIASAGVTPRIDEVFVLGIRGYYLDSQGRPGANDRGRYDDAICVVSPSAFVAFNGNTDPSATRRRMAVLKPGLWMYKPGTHGLSRPKEMRYPAFVQAAAVTVARDEVGDDTGWFGINIHRGGDGTTSSLGCQTIPPRQWAAFYELTMSELRRASQKLLPYILVDEAAYRKQRGAR